MNVQANTYPIYICKNNETIQVDRIASITHIDIETGAITNEKVKQVNDIFYLAMGIVGIKNLGQGIIHFAQNLPNNVKTLIRENRSIKSLLVEKYLEYRIAITQLKNSDDWGNLSAEVRQQIVQQEKSFICIIIYIAIFEFSIGDYNILKKEIDSLEHEINDLENPV
jgi:hypothetical protein